MTVKLYGYAELSQYEILDLFVIHYILGSRNINIYLYKGWQNLCLVINIDEDKEVIVHMNIIMEKVSSDHLTFLSLR